MLSRTGIDILIAPGIFGDSRLDVWSVPLFVVVGVFDQTLQTGISGGIAADIQTVTGEGIFEQLDLGLAAPTLAFLM